MKGFFGSEQTKSSGISKRGKPLSCASCGLYKQALSYPVQPFGNFGKRILNIGEAPGEVEDRRGKPWQGKVGRKLQYMYRQLGIDLFEDCLNVNSVNCRPPGNKTPTPHQIACCRNVMVDEIIMKYQPKVVVLLGGSALQTILGHRWKGNFGGITQWRGWTIPDQDYRMWIAPTYHPSFIVRSDEEAEMVWKQDLQRAIELTQKDFPIYKEPSIEFIDDLSILEHLDSTLVSIDYETTGLKPHARGHEIICASVSPNPDKAYVFMMPKTRREQRPFLNLLADPGISKMAHNMKFEEMWSRIILRQPVKGWKWDSMLAAHILDNRSGVVGLKFQTYTQLGVVDYASEVEPYLRADGGGNSFNTLRKLVQTKEGRHKAMKYCGHDTINEYRLAEMQIRQIDYDFLPFY